MLKIKLSSYNLMGDILKKIFEVIGLLSLACFSFFYTSQISSVIKENNDIYKEIKDISLQYKKEALDAKISGDDIIPGISGSVIDIDKSYEKMEKINSFNSNLLVYKNVKPNISIDDIYDKYIISGNKNKNQASLVFLLDVDDDISNILNILSNYDVKANFLIDYKDLNKNVLNLTQYGHNVLVYGDLKNINLSDFTSKEFFCFSNESDYLKHCSNYKIHTIKSNLIIKNTPLIEIKKVLNNGSIIVLENNNLVIKELPLIIEYINSKGINLVSISKLIEE